MFTVIPSLFAFALSLAVVIKGATMATKYASSLARHYNLSKYTVGFIIIAMISILPETFISIQSAISGIPSFGLGVLLGSNVADLTLVFALIVFLSGCDLKVERKILKNHVVYPFILLLPLILGLNGHFSRAEGVGLIVAGGVFYFLALRKGANGSLPNSNGTSGLRSVLMLLLSMGLLLLGSHFTVTSATSLAQYAGINPILIGMLIVGLGTTMPEFLFSLTSIKRGEDSLAIGDILGTVLADATIVVGILALVHPFFFPHKIIYITGAFMVAASLILFFLMRSGRILTKREALALCCFWITFVLVEFFANT